MLDFSDLTVRDDIHADGNDDKQIECSGTYMDQKYNVAIIPVCTKYAISEI